MNQKAPISVVLSKLKDVCGSQAVMLTTNQSQKWCKIVGTLLQTRALPCVLVFDWVIQKIKAAHFFETSRSFHLVYSDDWWVTYELFAGRGFKCADKRPGPCHTVGNTSDWRADIWGRWRRSVLQQGLAATCLRLLWHTWPSLCRSLHHYQEMVLQWPRQHVWQPHCQPLGNSSILNVQPKSWVHGSFPDYAESGCSNSVWPLVNLESLKKSGSGRLVTEKLGILWKVKARLWKLLFWTKVILKHVTWT